MRPISQCNETSEAGYTLLEILVVLVVAGILTAAVSSALPSSTSISPDRTVAELVSKVRAVRNAAIREGQTLDFEISATERRFRSQKGEDELPKDFQVVVTSAQELTNGEWSLIRFYPDGASSGGRIRLAHGEEHSEIVINWLTGRVEHVQ